jgi:hypothetical protein
MQLFTLNPKKLKKIKFFHILMCKNRVYLNLINSLIPVKVIIDYFKQIFLC